MATTLNMTLLLRRAEFADSCVLAAGEPGYHTGTHALKVGDGTTTWAELPFANEDTIKALIKAVDDKITALNDNYATDAEVEAIRAALQSAIDAKVSTETYNADKATFALKTEVEAVDGKVTTINNTLATYGDIVTHNVSEFGSKDDIDDINQTLTDITAANDGMIDTAKAAAIAAAKTETETQIAALDSKFETIANVDLVRGRLDDAEAAIAEIQDGENGILKAAQDYVDGKFTEADLDQYTTEQEVKDIVDGVIKTATDKETLDSLVELVEYIDTHSGDAINMATAIGVLEGKVETIEKKPAYEITAGQISNWDGEVGAKDLAQGVKDVVDANKTTWDKAGTALQAADLNGYALETYVDQAEADAIAEAARDAAAKYETIGTAQSIVDALKLGETYEPIGAETRAKSYTDTEISDFNTEVVAPIDARVKAIEDAPYTTKKYVDDQDAATLQAAKDYADGLDHEDTTYTFAATANALEFTATPAGKGEAQTIKLVAPVVDTGIMSVAQGNDIVVTPGENGSVTIAHETFTTGEYTKEPESSDKTGDQYFFTGITVDNGHVTGANVKSLASVLEAMKFVIDGGTAADTIA